MTASSPILVWRSEQASPPPWDRGVCRFCGTKLIFRNAHNSLSRSTTLTNCPLCGWNHVEDWAQEVVFTSGESLHRFSTLAQFDINSAELALSELGTHLKRNFADVYSLSWRRFEEIVENVLSLNGFRTVLTQPTRDTAADILILSQGGGVDAIVECKRIARGRKITVNTIRVLIGAAVDWDVRRVSLVTTGELTKPAWWKVAGYRDKGYEFEIVKGHELLTLLGVYNDMMPPLANLDDDARREIIERNTRALITEAQNGWPNGTPNLWY